MRLKILTILMARTVAWISSDLIPLIEVVQMERRDETRSHTIRVLLREALKNRGLLK